MIAEEKMMCAEEYKAAALARLGSLYAHKNWLTTGYFGVPSAVMRELVAEGHSEMRKRGPSEPAEYRSKTAFQFREQL